MTVPDPVPTRSDVLNVLAQAASKGRLGLFVGSGFSIGATDRQAPSFAELLKAVAENLKIDSDFTAEKFQMKSAPQIASALISELVAKDDISTTVAGFRFRKEIAKLCNVFPDEEKRPEYGNALGRAKPSWIVTTNYDLVLEALIDRSETVLPSESLFPNQERVPIYHLHGHRHYVDSIKVTEEDYVGLLAPLDYQRLKLPLLFAESTTLLLGYALGDINVRAAMQWARSFRSEAQRPGSDLNGKVIQAFFTYTPSNDPRIGEDGEIILETSNVAELLDEIGAMREDIAIQTAILEDDIKRFLQDKNKALAIKNHGDELKELLEIVNSSSRVGATEIVIEFLRTALEPIWTKALEPSEFEYYDAYLKVLIPLVKALKVTDASPNVMYYIAESLNKFGYNYSDHNAWGTAWNASVRWRNEAPGLDPVLLDELESLSFQDDFNGLKKLMRCTTLRK